MAITLDYEPDPRSAWRTFHHRRRIARHFGPHSNSTPMLITLLASLAFWAVIAYGLSLVI